MGGTSWKDLAHLSATTDRLLWLKWIFSFLSQQREKGKGEKNVWPFSEHSLESDMWFKCVRKKNKNERRGEKRWGSMSERANYSQGWVGRKKEGRQNGECRAKDTLHFEDVKTLIYPVHHLSLQDFYEGRRPWRLIKICYIFIQPSNWQFLSTLGIKGKNNHFPWGIICIVL